MTKNRPNRRFFKLGATVEDVRTIFERKNDATVYIPTLEYVENDNLPPIVH